MSFDFTMNCHLINHHDQTLPHNTPSPYYLPPLPYRPRRIAELKSVLVLVFPSKLAE
jgi:hypothetical protein